MISLELIKTGELFTQSSYQGLEGKADWEKVPKDEPHPTITKNQFPEIHKYK